MDRVQEYVLLEQELKHITVYRRDGEGWLQLVFGAGERMTFESLDFSIDVDTQYRGVV